MGFGFFSFACFNTLEHGDNIIINNQKLDSVMTSYSNHLSFCHTIINCKGVNKKCPATHKLPVYLPLNVYFCMNELLSIVKNFVCVCVWCLYGHVVEVARLQRRESG